MSFNVVVEINMKCLFFSCVSLLLAKLNRKIRVMHAKTEEKKKIDLMMGGYRYNALLNQTNLKAGTEGELGALSRSKCVNPNQM